MKITEKTRSEIALSIGKLSIVEAQKIASKVGCHMDSVYREWKKVRTKGATLNDDSIVLIELAELAVSRKPQADDRKKRLRKSIAQLSEA